MNEANYFIYIGHTNWSEHGSLDKESVFDINEIILHPMNYNENGTQQYYGPMDNADHASSVIDVGHLNTLQQTLNQIERQPQKCSDLYPTSQQLVVKRSLRCKKCDHNLSKPEYNPSLIKFKIQLSA